MREVNEGRLCQAAYIAILPSCCTVQQSSLRSSSHLCKLQDLRKHKIAYDKKFTPF
jgi:hypothetical protein